MVLSPWSIECNPFCAGIGDFGINAALKVELVCGAIGDDAWGSDVPCGLAVGVALCGDIFKACARDDVAGGSSSGCDRFGGELPSECESGGDQGDAGGWEDVLGCVVHGSAKKC